MWAEISLSQAWANKMHSLRWAQANVGLAQLVEICNLVERGLLLNIDKSILQKGEIIVYDLYYLNRLHA